MGERERERESMGAQVPSEATVPDLLELDLQVVKQQPDVQTGN